MITYLDQLNQAATEAGITLREAIISAGMPDSNYYRWVNGKTSPNGKTVARVMAHLDTIKCEKSQN